MDGKQLNNNDSLRVPYDENGDNGLVLCDKYIPEELIVEILFYIDDKSLFNCLLVCKRWNNLFKEYICKKKLEIFIGRSLILPQELSWDGYYRMCKRQPVDVNMVKNHSGQNGMSNWKITRQGGDHWKVECPPEGVPPLPDDSVFEGKNHCFVTSYYTCTKCQEINLINNGFSSIILDTLQPTITVGEWYSCRWDCPAIYEVNIDLVGKNNKVLHTHQFRESIIGDDKQNTWHHFEHEFKCYGPGVRKIIFQHSGCDNLYWAGHYGSKMSGASVILSYKPKKHENN